MWKGLVGSVRVDEMGWEVLYWMFMWNSLLRGRCRDNGEHNWKVGLIREDNVTICLGLEIDKSSAKMRQRWLYEALTLSLRLHTALIWLKFQAMAHSTWNEEGFNHIHNSTQEIVILINIGFFHSSSLALSVFPVGFDRPDRKYRRMFHDLYKENNVVSLSLIWIPLNPISWYVEFHKQLENCAAMSPPW
jgi:hypothetical protein